MTNASPQNTKKETQQASEKKWGKEVMKVGFNIIPALLLRAQRRLGLNSTQLNLLLHLTDYWWSADRMPYPTIDTLGERMGLKHRQVQRIITELENAGLIRRVERFAPHKGKMSNEYNLSGLVKKLREIAPEFLEADEQAKEARSKVTKRRPASKLTLKVVT